MEEDIQQTPTEDSPPNETTESDTNETIETVPKEDVTPGTEQPGEIPTPEVPKIPEMPLSSFEMQILEDPQLYSTNYLTDDYAITLIHEFTLGDVLVSTLLCVLIVVQVLKAVLGGGRRW